MVKYNSLKNGLLKRAFKVAPVKEEKGIFPSSSLPRPRSVIQRLTSHRVPSIAMGS
jgi:hypothetical protein